MQIVRSEIRSRKKAVLRHLREIKGWIAGWRKETSRAEDEDEGKEGGCLALSVSGL